VQFRLSCRRPIASRPRCYWTSFDGFDLALLAIENYHSDRWVSDPVAQIQLGFLYRLATFGVGRIANLMYDHAVSVCKHYCSVNADDMTDLWL